MKDDGTQEAESLQRVRVLVLGGGIHGVGVAHDLASRGWKDVLLVDKGSIGGGTSSRSTKLIHGGLRYLKHLSQYGLVADSLRERSFLTDIAPDIVKPIEMLFPIKKGEFWEGAKTKVGLSIYDALSFGYKGLRHSNLSFGAAAEKAPLLDYSKFRSIYSFWDGQTDDLALVHRVAGSARSLGAKISEHWEALRIDEYERGWMVEIQNTKTKDTRKISARYIVNCMGPWANLLLEKSGIAPKVNGINDKGSHLLVEDLGLKAGLFLKSPVDGRVVFALPWKEKTLLGTTEEVFTGSPDSVYATEKDIEYILASVNPYFKEALRKKDVVATFSGLRWLVAGRDGELSSLSRESELGTHTTEGGLLLTLYGGKLTGYRSICEMIGNKIVAHFGEDTSSKTKEVSSWIQSSELPDHFEDVLKRFS